MTQDKAIEILKSGANVFLTGKPGSGKTYTINKFVEECNKKGVYPTITASTGIAATHIGGVTIHSWISFADFMHDMNQGKEISDTQIEATAQKWYIRKKIMRARILIIDEVSMLHGGVLDLVDRVCREVRGNRHGPFGGLQVVLVGDFYQLPPVTKGNLPVDFAFKSKVWDELNLKVCFIHEQHRTEDDDYIEILTAMREGRVEDKHIQQLQTRLKLKEKVYTTKLFTKNMDVDYLNNSELAKLKTDAHSYKMEESGNPNLVKILKRDCLSPENLTLKIGALVMFTRNNPDEGFVNGTLGMVTGFDDNNFPLVTLDDKDRTVTPKQMEWSIKVEGIVEAAIQQVPLKLAWAITVHKSQGMSMDSAIIDLGDCFEYGQGYVALSRVKSLKGLYLEGLNKKTFEMHPEIVEKDKEFMDKSKSNE